MSTSVREDEDFAQKVLDANSMLERAIDWISNNMYPDDIFSKSKLEQWARNSGFTKE